MRATLLWLHRWIGITTGLIVLVIAITGGMLVFERKLERWLHPELFPKTSSLGRTAPISMSIDNVERAHPGVRLTGIVLPSFAGDALRLFSGPRAFYCDPTTGKELGFLDRNGSFFRTLTQLHVSLLLGKTGGTIVAITTLLIIVIALSGLWLWWPLRIISISNGSKVRRFYLDLHCVAGLYSSLFLLVIAVTGATMHYLHHGHPQGQPSTPLPTGPIFTVDEAIVAAGAALPGAMVRSLEMPGQNPRAPLHLQLAFPEDASPAGRSVVFLDAYSGAVLDVHSSRSGSWLDRYQELQLSIHTGAIFGWPTQWVALLTCIALLLQVVSGYVLWWKRA